MTYTMPPEQLVVNSLLDGLRAHLGSSIKVGDHEAPPNPGLPYAIVYSLAGGDQWGAPLWRPEESVGLPFQVSCVGSRRDQAQWLADKVDEFVLGVDAAGAFVHPLELPEGWVCCGRLGEAASSGLQVEGTSKDRRFTAPQRYTLQVTPA